MCGWRGNKIEALPNRQYTIYIVHTRHIHTILLSKHLYLKCIYWEWLWFRFRSFSDEWTAAEQLPADTTHFWARSLTVKECSSQHPLSIAWLTLYRRGEFISVFFQTHRKNTNEQPITYSLDNLLELKKKYGYFVRTWNWKSIVIFFRYTKYYTIKILPRTHIHVSNLR